MTEMQGVILRGALLTVILVLAVSSELRTKHLPNLLTLGGLVAALAAAAFTGHLLDALGGFVVVAVPFLFAFSRHWLHGGGVKLALALGASVGLVGAPVIVLGAAFVFLGGRALRSRKPPTEIGPKVDSSPWLAAFSVLGFALSAAKLLQ